VERAVCALAETTRLALLAVPGTLRERAREDRTSDLRFRSPRGAGTGFGSRAGIPPLIAHIQSDPLPRLNPLEPARPVSYGSEGGSGA
jgi:hypothetical protein